MSDPADDVQRLITEARQLRMAGSQLLSFERLCDAVEALSARVDMISSLLVNSCPEAARVVKVAAGVGPEGEA
jgi:hypothetical protein